MGYEFCIQNSAVITTGENDPKTFLQIKAEEDLEGLVPFVYLDGQQPTNKQVLVELLRGGAEEFSQTSSPGVPVIPVAMDENASDAQATVEAAVKAYENAATAKIEPDYTGAKKLPGGIVHPQGQWVSPFAFKLKTGQTLSIRLDPETNAVGALCGFYGRRA